MAYWQGMHDVLAVLLLMEPQPPLERVFLLYSVFLKTFSRSIFDNSECMFLYHSFEMIRLLLQYHDPRASSLYRSRLELAMYLQGFNIAPPMYSLSWIVTFFAHDVCQPLLLSIWDQYIFYRNPVIHIFTMLAHLITNKARILSYPSSDLMELMTHLPFDNDNTSYVFQGHADDTAREGDPIDAVCQSLNEELRGRTCDERIITGLVRDGVQLMQRTPAGFVHRLNDLLNDHVTMSSESLNAYLQSACLMPSPLEIYTFLLSGAEHNTHCLHYLLLDTRAPAEYRKAHLRQSRNVTEHTLLNLERIDILVRKSRTHECHIVVLDGTDGRGEDRVCDQLVELLLKKGCRYVSRVVGGFGRVAKLAQMEGKEKELIATEEEEKEVERRKGVAQVTQAAQTGQSGQSGQAPQMGEERREIIKTVGGKKCLLYDAWISNPLVRHFVCKKVVKTKKEGSDVFSTTAEKEIVLTQ